MSERFRMNCLDYGSDFENENDGPSGVVDVEVRHVVRLAVGDREARSIVYLDVDQARTLSVEIMKAAVAAAKEG